MKIEFPNNISLSKILPKIGKQASSPGIIKYIWRERESEVKIKLIDYNETDINEKNLLTLDKSIQLKDTQSIKWINITGVHDESIIHKMWEIYNIHPLVLEDISNTTQRAKIEEYDDYLFVIIKMIYFSNETNEITVEQVSLIVWDNYIISLQEREGDVFNWVRERIRKNKGKICKSWSDYLMYAILDAIVDQYFSVIEQMSEKIEDTEEQLMFWVDQELLNKIYSLKKELVYIKKSIWPLREVISTLNRAENELIKETTFIYLRDVYDHTIQVLETVETFRDLTSGMLDLYLSTVSNKMNEIMKVLTIFAAIFIPLTFIAWVYWMNFQFMPELWWKYAYPIWWAIIVVLTIIMLIIFKRKKWI